MQNRLTELCFTFIKCKDRFITTFDIVYFIAHMQLFLRTLRNILNKTKKRFLLTNWSLPFVKSQRVDFRNCTFVDEWTDCPQFLGDVCIVSRSHWWGQFWQCRVGQWTSPCLLTSRMLSGTTRATFILSKLIQFSPIKTRLLARLYSLLFVGILCCRRTLGRCCWDASSL